MFPLFVWENFYGVQFFLKKKLKFRQHRTSAKLYLVPLVVADEHPHPVPERLHPELAPPAAVVKEPSHLQRTTGMIRFIDL